MAEAPQANFGTERRVSAEKKAINRWRGDLLAVGALVFTIALVVWIQFWRQAGLSDWDVVTYYFPSYAFLGGHVRHFQIPGWNPFIFSGTPFAGNPQSGWMYFPAMLIFAIFSPLTAFRVFIGVLLALGGLSTYWFVRLLNVGIAGSLAAAVVFTFGQNYGATTCCTIHLQLDAWLPMAFVGIELAARARSWNQRLPAPMLSSLAVSQIIASWIGQGAYYGLLAIAAYLGFRTIIAPLTAHGSWRARANALVLEGLAIFGFGIFLSAAGLLPRLDVSARTFVGSAAYQGANFPSDWGWNGSTALGYLISYQPTWRPYYVGAAAFVCAAAALIALRRSSIARFFAGFSLVVIILPMHPTPIHWLFYMLPRFRGLHLHDPGRVMAILPIGVSVLVALGVSMVPDVVLRRRGLMLAVMPGLCWLALVGLLPSDANHVISTTWIVLIVASLILLLGSMGLRLNGASKYRLGVVRASQAALIVLLFLDPTGISLIKSFQGEASARTSQGIVQTQTSTSDIGGAGAFLQERLAAGGGRFFGFVNPPYDAQWQLHEHYMEPDVLSVLANNRAMQLGLQDVQGYDPSHLLNYLDFFRTLNGFQRDYHEELVYPNGLSSPLLNLLNVRYVVVPLDVPLNLDSSRYQEVFRNGSVRVLENMQALPRAWIVHSAEQQDPASSLKMLAAGSVDPRTTALVSSVPPALSQSALGPDEMVSIANYADDRIQLTVKADSAGMVVLSEIYDTGWRAYVDGERTSIYQVDGALRGVVVSSGRHTLELRYEPASLRVGVVISLATPLAMAVIAVWFAMTLFLSRRQGRRRMTSSLDSTRIRPLEANTNADHLHSP